MFTRAGSRRERLHGALHNLPRGPLGVMRIERDMLRAGDVGLGGSGDHLGVTAGGHLGKRRHDALHVHHHQVHRAGEQRQFLVQIVAGNRHALPHQDFVGRATNPGDVDAFGARLPRQREQVAVAAGGHDHLAQNRLMPVHQDIDLLLFEHSQVGLRPNRLRPAEEHVLHVGGDHGAAPAIGQRGAHGGAQQRYRVRFHAVVRAVQQLDDFAVDAARRDAHLLPSPALFLGGAQRRDERAFLQAELRSHTSGQVRRHLALVRLADSRPIRPPAPSASPGWRWHIPKRSRLAPHLHHFAPMVAVRRRAARHRARQVAGHDQVRIGAARSHLRPFAERIDAARPHVADIAAQPELAEPAERLQVVVTVPHGLGADSCARTSISRAAGSAERF
jgi:hypothetical protein